MPESHRNKKFVYHLTPVANLPSIVEHGLLPRATLVTMGLVHVDVADEEILAGRGAALSKRVPFHFIARSPFDYAVFRRTPEHRYVLIAVERTLAKRQHWEIVPRHPLAGGEDFQVHDWDSGLEKIDWEQLDRYPRPYDDDHACRLACMAEALAPGVVPFCDIKKLFFESQADLEMACGTTGALKNCLPQQNPSMFPRRP